MNANYRIVKIGNKYFPQTRLKHVVKTKLIATREHQSGNEVVSEDTANQLLPIKKGERESVFTFLNTKTCISLADMRFFL